MRSVRTVLSVSGVLAALAAPLPAAVTSSLLVDALTVETTAGDSVTITDDAGVLKVNGSDPLGSELNTAAVNAITVIGDDAVNTIDLSAVATPAFNSGLLVRIEGSIGSDIIIGSSFGDTILPGPGTDDIDGGPGNDRIEIWPGDGSNNFDGQGGQADEMVVFGTEDGDLLLVDSGFDGSPTVSRFLDTTCVGLNVERVVAMGLGGTDLIGVSSSGTFSADRVTIWGGPDDDTMDLSPAIGRVDVRYEPGDGNDTIDGATAAPVNAIIDLSSLKDPVNVVGTPGTSYYNVALSGSTTGGIDFIDVRALGIFSGADSDDIDIQTPEFQGLQVVNIDSREGDDTIHVDLSPQVSYDIDGSIGTLDTLFVRPWGDLPQYGSGKVTAPGTQAIDYTGVEKINIEAPPPSSYWVTR
ncbi:hypothetical protein KQI84_13875 [bacterium]|nr:hypothetical protein [bacterium]